MVEEAKEETFERIKKLDQLMRANEDVDEFKSILSTIAPTVVRILVGAKGLFINDVITLGGGRGGTMG